MYDQDDDMPLMSREKFHSLLKGVSYIILPTYASLYFILSFIWDFPAVANVLGVLFLIVLCLNALIELTAKYDGQIVITRTPAGKRLFSLELDRDPKDLENLEQVLFKVTDEKSFDYEDPTA